MAPCIFTNWQVLSLSPKISATSHFSSNGIQAIFLHTKKVNAYNEALQRVLLDAKRLKQSPDNHELIQACPQRMRQEVYRQFVIKVLSDLQSEFIDPDTPLDHNTPGHSADVLWELLVKPIYVAIARTKVAKGKVPKVSHRPVTRSQAEEDSRPVSQFLQGLRSLFDWDDGYQRRNWDRYAYRELAKQAFDWLSSILGIDEATQWRSSLGLYAT
jgi:hypothetical protein